MRVRMRTFVLRFQETEVYIKDTADPRKKIWCSYSKTPQQRRRSGHAAWIKRAVCAAAADREKDLKIEYSSGTAWMGESRLCSAALPPEPQQHEHLIHTNELDIAAWVRVDLMAREVGVTLECGALH